MARFVLVSSFFFGYDLRVLDLADCIIHVKLPYRIVSYRNLQKICTSIRCFYRLQPYRLSAC